MKQQKNWCIKVRKNHSYMNGWKRVEMTKLRIVFKSPSINSIQIFGPAHNNKFLPLRSASMLFI